MKISIPIEVKFDDMESLINDLAHLQTYKLAEDDEMTLVDTNDVADILCKHVKAKEPERKTGWIPCSERLPEPRIDVWVCSDLGQMVAYYEENVGTWYGRNYWELLVTAWMPLPEPYQEVEYG